MEKNKYVIRMAKVQELYELKKPRLKRPTPKINIISINTGSVFDEY